MMEVSLLKPEEEISYDKFLSSLPNRLVYPSFYFRNFLSEAVGGDAVYLAARRDGVICGVLPLFIKRDPDFGSIINSLPWYGSYGGISAAYDDEETWRALIDAYLSIVHEPDVLTAVLITNPFQTTVAERYRIALTPWYFEDRICQITPLPSSMPESEDALMALYSKKTRNLVRKAYKMDFHLEITDEEWGWKFLYETHVENMQAIGGRHKPQSHFQAMRECIPARHRRLTVALFGTEPVAAMLLLLFGNTVEYITPVIKHEYRSLQPLTRLVHDGMVFAARNDYVWWNWGGTWKTQESLHHFKAGWGARDYAYAYLIHTTPRSLDILRENIKILQSRHPYYYLLPYTLMNKP